MRRRVWIVGIVVLLGCSPLSRLKCRFDLPKGQSDRGPERLHVRARVVCGGVVDPDSGALVQPTPPEPGLEEDPEDSLMVLPDGGMQVLPRSAIRRAAVRRDGWSVEISERGSSCTAAMTAWYDVDGNGKVDPGEPVGRLPATLFRDRGLCAGNLTVAGPIEMSVLAR